MKEEGYYRIGESVSQGDIIGVIGASGESTGQHLHFALEIDGERVNPGLYLPLEN